MAFIMPACTKHNNSSLHWLCQAVGSLCLLLGTANSAHAGNGFVIQQAEAELQNNVYHINANIDYSLSEEALSALKNGVPLIIKIDIAVLQERNWWWDKQIAQLEQSYLLIYHALSEKFIVHNLNTGTQENFSSLRTALATLGRIDKLPILDANLLEVDTNYLFQLHTLLDIEALPAPMRPLAYISTEWQLESDWYTWSLVR